MLDLHIRPLQKSDLDFALDLSGLAGWNQLEPDWERYRSLEPEGCFLSEVDGKRAGTATTTCYGKDLAWIGMVLVHPDFRRRGVGTELLSHTIHHLREVRRIHCVKLDATNEGRPLYEKLGFQAEWGLHRWTRLAETAGEPLAKPPLDLDENTLQLDRAVFGADRRPLLESLSHDAMARCQTEDGSFGVSRDGARAIYIGPITATDAAQGERIARELISQVPLGRHIFWDLPDANEAAVALARSLGFEPVRELTRMWLGDTRILSDPQRTWGISDFGLG